MAAGAHCTEHAVAVRVNPCVVCSSFCTPSGNAYALLALHRATALAAVGGGAAGGNVNGGGGGGGDPRWLHRARQFAAFTYSVEGRSVYDTPDRYGTPYQGLWVVRCTGGRKAQDGCPTQLYVFQPKP